jgi:glucokinase
MGPLRRSLAEHAALPFITTVDLAPALLGTDASLIGAAALIHHSERYAGNERVAATLVAG